MRLRSIGCGSGLVGESLGSSLSHLVSLSSPRNNYRSWVGPHPSQLAWIHESCAAFVESWMLYAGLPVYWCRSITSPGYKLRTSIEISPRCIKSYCISFQFLDSSSLLPGFFPLSRHVRFRASNQNIYCYKLIVYLHPPSITGNSLQLLLLVTLNIQYIFWQIRLLYYAQIVLLHNFKLNKNVLLKNMLG